MPDSIEDLIRKYFNGTLSPEEQNRFATYRQQGVITDDDLETWRALRAAALARAERQATTLPPLPDFAAHDRANGYQKETNPMQLQTTYPRPVNRYLERLALTAAAFMIAVFGALVVMIVHNQPPDNAGSATAITESDSATADTVMVVVALRDISRFEPLTADMLMLAEWPASTPPTGAFTAVGDLLGAESVVNVPAGHLIDDFIVPDYALDGLNDILATDLPDRNILLNRKTGYEVLTGLPDRTQFKELVDSMPAFRTLLQSTYPQMILAPGNALLTAEQAGALRADDEAMLAYLRDHIYMPGRLTVEVPDGVSVSGAVGLEGGGAVLLLDSSIAVVENVEVMVPVSNDLIARLSAGDRVAVLTTTEMTESDDPYYRTARQIDAVTVAQATEDYVTLSVPFDEVEPLQTVLESSRSYSLLPLDAEEDLVNLDAVVENWIRVPVDPGTLTDIRLGDWVSVGLSYDGDMGMRTWHGGGIVLSASLRTNDYLLPLDTVDHRLARSVTLLLPEAGAAIVQDLAEDRLLSSATLTRRGLDVTQVGRDILFQAGEPGSCGTQNGYRAESDFFTLPLATSEFTVEREYGPYQPGIEIMVEAGTPVLAASAGRVIFAGWNSFGYGNMIALSHGDRITVYAHLNDINVMCGYIVSTGRIIGTSGVSGNIANPGLYFEMRERGSNGMSDSFVPVDPAELIDSLN